MKTAAAAPSRKPAVSLLALAGVAFFLLVLIAPLMTFGEVSATSAQFTGEGSLYRQIGYVLILGMAIYATRRESGRWTALAMPWPIILVLVWCWLSLTWAVEPGIAVRRLILTSIAVWTTFILVQGAGYKRSMAVLRAMLVVALVGNYVTVLVDPAVGIHLMLDSSVSTALVGNWRGFMTHKNYAGAACALCILVFVFDARRIHWGVRLAVLVAAGAFLFKTQSKTSAGMLGIALLAGWIFQRYDRQIRTFAIPALLVLSAVVLTLDSAFHQLVAEQYFNAASFTGRGLIWQAMLRYAADNPLLGAGFGSFWNIGADSPIYDYGQGFVRQVTIGHNGYLDLLVTIGLPGLVVAVFASVVWPLVRLLVKPIEPARGAVVVALLLFCIGHNMTESSLLERDSLVGVVMMLAIAVVAQPGAGGTGSVGRSSGDDLFRALRARTMPVPGAPV